MQKIILISCVEKCTLGIGSEGDLLNRYPEDMAYFRERTDGHPVVMGMNTWKSIPEKFRPLRGRNNIILTHSTDKVKGAVIKHSIEDILEYLKNEEEIFVIGGESVYRQFMPYANFLDLNFVDSQDYPKKITAYFPEITSDWVQIQWKALNGKSSIMHADYIKKPALIEEFNLPRL